MVTGQDNHTRDADNGQLWPTLSKADLSNLIGGGLIATTLAREDGSGSAQHSNIEDCTNRLEEF